MPDFAQCSVRVPGGVGSPVRMAIELMHVSVLWTVLGKVLLDCGGCLHWHLSRKCGRHRVLIWC